MKKVIKKIFFVLCVMSIPSSALADVSVYLDVEAPSGTLYAQTLSVVPCPVTDDPATTTVSAKCALEQATLSPVWSSFGDDLFLTTAGGANQDFAHNLFWNWWADLSYGQTALNKHELTDGEHLLVALGVLPLKIEVSSNPTVEATTTITVSEFGFDASFNGVWLPSLGSTVGAAGQSYSTNVNGVVEIVATSTDSLIISASKTGFVPATPVTVTPITVTSPAPVTPPAGGGGGGGGGGSVFAAQLNTATALAYLVSNQHTDGSFDSILLSDWAAIAFASIDSGIPKANLRMYMLSSTPTILSGTDFERHAMALEALGINPYSGTSVDYITPIVNSFDGTQMGDVHLDNDDIFSLFPLLHAGYSTGDVIIQKTTAFILSAQNANGAWDGSVDMTAAAIQALTQVSSLPNVSSAITKAEAYLHSVELVNGGFSNSFSTSWVLQAISALQQSPVLTWAPDGYTPQNYLTTLQQSDGGIEPTTSPAQTRIWATEYAIPASLGKTWASLLQSFPRSSLTISNSSSAATLVASSTMATSTPSILQIATTTRVAEVTSTTTTTVVPLTQQAKPKVKVLPQPKVTMIPQPTVQSILPQTAAVVSAPHTHFLTNLWNAIASFFSSIL